MKPVLRSFKEVVNLPDDWQIEMESVDTISQWLPYRQKTEMRVGRVSPLAFSLMLALGTAIIADPAHASNIQADKSAPHNQQPIVAQTANGLPQVNIQTPTSAGVSVNQYRQFDVDNKGAILNNSRRNTQTQLGGWIQGNPFLATGEARVIVNQVNSANPSLLNGYIEVGGQRAEVVLANPAGIQVNGGGFINASSATLTTGTPFIRSGQVDKYLVRDGQISIKGKGLDAKDMDFTRILSRYIDVDAPVFANDLQVVAGSNDVAVDGSVSAQKAMANPNRAVAIDTGELGGMYANKITLISTENNQRIDNKGQIFAQAGGVVLDSQGNLQNAGTIASQGTANIQAKDVFNSGTLSAKEQFDVRAQSLDNSGTVLASGEWNAQLDQLVNTGAIQSARLDIRARQLDNIGEISQTGLQGLAIENTGTFSNNGKIGYPEADIASANNGASNSSTLSANDSSIPAPTTATGSGSIGGSSSTALPTFANGRIQTSQSLNNAGTIQANGSIDLTAKNGLSNVGKLNINTLTVSGDTLDNQKGRLNAQTANIQTQNLYNQEGQIFAVQQLNSTNNLIDNTKGSITSTGHIQLDSQTLRNNGTLIAQKDLNITLQHDFVAEQAIQAGQNLSLHSVANLTNPTRLEAGNSVHLVAQNIENLANASIQAERETALQTQQNIYNHGLINSNGLTLLQAGQTIENIDAGKIYGDKVALSGQELINGKQLQQNSTVSATIAARERLDIGATQITNQEDATLFSGGHLQMGRTLDANQQAIGIADSIKNLSATIEALGNGVLSSKQILNRNEHFSIQPEVEVGQPKDFHEISPRGQDGRRIDWDKLKWAHFSRAKKLVFKTNNELGSDIPVVLGETPLPNIFELDMSGEIRQDALYLPDDAAWTYFGIEPPKTNPPPIPTGMVEPSLPEGKTEEECQTNRDACAQYWIDREPFDLAMKPYNDWYAENAEAYQKLDEAITQYNRNKAGEEFKDFTIYKYQRRFYEDQVASSKPANILTGGNLLLTGGDVINDKSRIVAGKTLLGGLDNIQNINADAFKYQKDIGTSQYTKTRWRGGVKRYHQRDWDNVNDYKVEVKTPTVLNVAETHQNTAVTFSHQTPEQHQGQNQTVSNNPLNTIQLPTSSLFTTNPNRPDILIESDARFTDYRRWLGSDYMLDALHQDPNYTHKRLGDGYYEQRLLRNQIINLTGQRFLDGYHSDEEQFKALMDNGLTFAKAQQLSVGIALSAEQVARLTSDIVWLEYQTVQLPDGSSQKVLVPKVYVLPRSGDLKNTGALIAAQDLKLDLSGNLTNSGTLNSRNVMVLNAENINMLGNAQGQSVGMMARQNVNVLGGEVRAQDTLNVQAGGQVQIASTTLNSRSQGKNFTGERTDIGRIAGLYVTGNNGTLHVAADSVKLSGAVLDNQGEGNTVLQAKQNIEIGTVQTHYKNSTVSDSKNYLIEGETQEVGSQISGKGDVYLQSGGSTHIRGSQINSETGKLAVSADDLTITAGENSREFAESHYHKHGSAVGKSSTERRHQSAQTQAVSSTLAGNEVLLHSNHDMQITGSQMVSDAYTQLSAKGDIHLNAAENTQYREDYAKDTRSGLTASLSNGVTSIGYQKSSNKDRSESHNTSLTLSQVGSQTGNTTIVAGKALNTEAARLYTGQDLTLQGSEVNLNATYASHNQHAEQERTQKGFSVGVTYNPIQAAKSAYDNAKQNEQFTNTAVGKIMGTADAGARAGLALTPIVVGAGSSRTQQQQDTVSREAIRTEAQAGGNLNIIATESDIRTQGAKLSAEGDALLQAQRDIQLDITQNDTIQTGEQNRKGWSIDTRQIGVVGTHKQNENADLHTTTAKGTELSVGGKATLLAQTGNISVRGSSVVSQQDLVLNAAQNVSLESAQNTQNQINQKTSKGIGSAQISDTEQFFGYMNNQNRQTSDTVEQVRSQVGSLSGNVSVHAGETYTQSASDLLANQNIDVSAKSIDAHSAYNTGKQTQFEKDTKIGTFASVSSPILDTINATDSALNSKADDRTKALQSLAAIGQGYQLNDAVNKGATLLKAEAGIGFKTGKNQSESEYSQSQGNLIQAGGNIRMNASDGDLRLQHTQATANGTLALHAQDNLYLESGINTRNQHGENKNYGAEIGVGASVGAQTGAYIYGEAQFGKGSYNVNETTHSNSHLNANHVLLSSGQDTILKGATVQGNRIDAQVGGKLHVESLQDSLEQSSRQTGMGGRVQGGFGSVWSADANYSSDKTSGHRQAVAEQTGLFAGDGGYHIQADSVHLKGGAIASISHRNELNSNTFSHENIQNQREHEVSSTVLSAGWGEKTGGTFSPNLPQKQTGGDDSTTQAVLSEGQIRIGGRETSTAELGIRNQANGAYQTLSAQEDLQAIAQKQKTVAQATAQIQSAVKTYNENRIAQYEQEKAQIVQILTAQMSSEEQEAFKQKSDSEKEQYYKQHSTTYQQLDQQADSWGTGGANSRAVNAATTAITGLLGGQNLQQAAMNAGSPYIAETIGNTLSEHGSMPNGWAWLLAHGALGAITAETNGGNAATGALSAAGAELVVSIAAEKLFGDKALDETGKFNADRLSEDEKKQLSALGAATGAVLGMGVGGNSYNAQVGGVVAQNAVENNWLYSQTAKQKGWLSKTEIELLDRLAQQSGARNIEYFIQEEQKIHQSKRSVADKEKALANLKREYEADSQKMEATAAKLPKGSKERGMLYDITSKMQGIVSVIVPYKESEIIRAEQRDWLPTSSPFYVGNSGFVAVQQQWAINDGKTPEEARFQTEMPAAGRGGGLKSTTRNTKPQTQKEIDKIGIPYNKSSNPFSPVQETDKFGNEIYYRTMSEKDYQTLQMTGKLPASQTKETSISPVRSYSSQYDGILVKLVVKPNTSAELQKIGISANLKTTEVLNLPFKGGEKGKWQSMDIPFKGKGWSETNTRFKVEGGQTTTQLGSGKGLEIFNRNIVDFQLIDK